MRTWVGVQNTANLSVMTFIVKTFDLGVGCFGPKCSIIWKDTHKEMDSSVHFYWGAKGFQVSLLEGDFSSWTPVPPALENICSQGTEGQREMVCTNIEVLVDKALSCLSALLKCSCWRETVLWSSADTSPTIKKESNIWLEKSTNTHTPPHTSHVVQISSKSGQTTCFVVLMILEHFKIR